MSTHEYYREKGFSHYIATLRMTNWDIGTGVCETTTTPPINYITPLSYPKPATCSYCGMLLEEGKCVACGAPQ